MVRGRTSSSRASRFESIRRSTPDVARRAGPRAARPACGSSCRRRRSGRRAASASGWRPTKPLAPRTRIGPCRRRILIAGLHARAAASSRGHRSEVIDDRCCVERLARESPGLRTGLGDARLARPRAAHAGTLEARRREPAPRRPRPSASRRRLRRSATRPRSASGTPASAARGPAMGARAAAHETITTRAAHAARRQQRLGPTAVDAMLPSATSATSPPVPEHAARGRVRSAPSSPGDLGAHARQPQVGRAGRPARRAHRGAPPAGRRPARSRPGPAARA